MHIIDYGAKMIIVCFSTVRWNGLWQRHQQIMSRLAERGHNIIYIEPNNYQKEATKRSEIIDKSKRDGKIINVKLKYYPLHHKIKILQDIDSIKILFALRKALKKINAQEIDVLWLFSPYHNFVVNFIKYKVLVYDCADESEGFYYSEGQKRWILHEERNLLNKANVVFATTSNLYDRCYGQNTNTHLIPNGVDYDFFSRGKSHIISEFEEISHPRIGFVGAIAAWIDCELLFEMAHMNKGTSFVFVGPILFENAMINRLRELDNTYFLGEKIYDKIPACIHEFDACIIPFKISSLTQSSHPIKLLEYFAIGKPVIASQLKEFDKFGDLIYLISANSFEENVKKALSENSVLLKERRQKVAMAYSWDAFVASMEDEIYKLLS